MSKAMIGIKIADGSFYPILEEGVPGEKKLEVTTARDKQTTVQINLYRSESGNMEDADYVDTLLIDDLKPHQKKEPSFDLIVKIDENNMLSAEIDDPETGGKSDTKVSLVNMGNKSIFDEPDYKVSSDDMPAIEGEEINIPTDTVAETPTLEESSVAEANAEEFSLADSLSNIPDLDDTQLAAGADDFALPDFDSLDAPEEQNEANADDFALPDFDSMTAPQEEASASELPAEIDIPTENADVPGASDVTEAIAETPVVEEPPAADAGADDFSLPDFDSMTAPQEEAPQEQSDTSASDDFSLPEFDSLVVPQEANETDAENDLSLPDFEETPQVADETDAGSDFDAPEFETSNTTTGEMLEEPIADSAGADDFALPDFDSMTAPEEPVVSESVANDDFSFDMSEEPVTEELVTQEPVAESVLTDEDFSFSTDFTDDEKDVDDDEKPFSFDSLPDFDEIPELANSSGDSESVMDDDLDIDFSIPEDNDMRKNNYNDTYDSVSDSQPDYNYAPSGNMQSALFGGDDLFEETKKQKERKALVPVIICILCALISLGVLGVILYLTPSIMKLAGGMQSEETTVVSVAETESVAAEEEIIVEEPTIRKAEENKIVVLNETVPPVVPETKKEQTEISSIIRHLVKWGDTLWDLAGFYYRNPWLYRIISDANNLENPDLIISGTYLTIPER